MELLYNCFKESCFGNCSCVFPKSKIANFVKLYVEKSLTNWKFLTEDHHHNVYDLITSKYLYIYCAIKKLYGNDSATYNKVYRQFFRIGKRKLDKLMNIRESVVEFQRLESYISVIGIHRKILINYINNNNLNMKIKILKRFTVLVGEYLSLEKVKILDLNKQKKEYAVT